MKISKFWRCDKRTRIKIWLTKLLCYISISKVHIKVKALTDGTIYSTLEEVVLFLFPVSFKELFCLYTMCFVQPTACKLYRCTECTVSFWWAQMYRCDSSWIWSRQRWGDGKLHFTRLDKLFTLLSGKFIVLLSDSFKLWLHNQIQAWWK